MPNHRSVTIVVPVYGDAESLEKCLLSVLKHTDLHVHSLLVVNDCGPDADALEKLVLRILDGREGTRYERNDHNLGFVATCNRAVLKLDGSRNDALLLNSDTVVGAGWIEGLIGALAVDPTVGIVCPRSNNASLASFPPRTVDGRRWPTDKSRTLHQELAPLLPEITISPVAVGFCFLVRREVIDSLGLFDDVFSPGYGEENDLCRRALSAGWKSALANRIFVEHAGAASFSSARKDKLARNHERLLRRRHPDYWDAVLTFERVGRHPLDMFAAVLARQPGKMSVIGFSAAREAAEVARQLREHGPDDDITVAVPAWYQPFARLLVERHVAKVIRQGDEIGRVWHAAVVTERSPHEARIRAQWSAWQILSDRAALDARASFGPGDLHAKVALRGGVGDARRLPRLLGPSAVGRALRSVLGRSRA